MKTKNQSGSAIFDRQILLNAIKDSLRKLNPKTQLKNPVMFVVFIGSILTTILFFKELAEGTFNSFNLQITIWLWFTVLFANFAEAIAEGRGKA
jgi:K+-transporting ATPase ATPase B chain